MATVRDIRPPSGERIASDAAALELGRAWAAAEDSLPDGWWIRSLTLHSEPYNPVFSERLWWEALAQGIVGPIGGEESATGPTRVAALHNLAALFLAAARGRPTG